MNEQQKVQSLSDAALLRSLADLVRQSRRVEADLVAHIAEVDARRLFAREAMPSMFAYCTEVLHLSEPETGLRIHVARACEEHPVLLDMLRDGRLHLSGIAVLTPHLTPDNRDGFLERATHRSKRQIEEPVAELKARPDAPALVRRLPGRGEHRPDDAGEGDLAANGSGGSPAAPAGGSVEAERPGVTAGRARGPEHRPDDVGRRPSTPAGRASSSTRRPRRAVGRESGPTWRSHWPAT